MDCPRCAHAHRKRCRTRCFDSTLLRIVHGLRRDLLHISNKKRTSCEMRYFFKMVVGDGPTEHILITA